MNSIKSDLNQRLEKVWEMWEKVWNEVGNYEKY